MPPRKTRRPITAAVTAVALLALMVAMPGMAVAQSDDYRASGEASGFAVELPEAAEIVGGRSQAEISSDPLAYARGAGFLSAEGSISEVRVEQSGVSRREPESGQNCATPQIPEPLDVVDVACSFAEAETLGGLPSSLSDAGGLELALTGADVEALVDFLLGHIDESGLTEAIREAEAQLLDPVRTALAEACLDAMGGTVGDGIDEAGQLIAAIEDETGISAEIDGEAACDLLLEYTLDPPLLGGDGEGSSADALLALLRDTLAAALQDVSLLDILLGGSTSEGVASAATAVGSATSIGVDIGLPSLNLLGNLVEVLTSLTSEFVDQVVADVADVVETSVLEELPSAAELVDTLLEAVPQELQDVLDDDQALLRITGGRSQASATFDRSADEVSTDGQVAPLVVDLADSLAALLGISDQDPITVPEGDEFTVAEGTPLESTGKLAACTSEDAVEEDLDGQRINCDGLELVLVKGLVGDDPDTDEPDGGIRVAAASAEAAAFGAIEEAPAPAPARDELPVTGGGVALLAMVLLGAGLGLRRRL